MDLIEWDPLKRSGFVVVRAYLEDGVVLLDGEKNVVELLEKGIDSCFPSDGYPFLACMTKTFRNPYLLATHIQTGVMPQDFGSVKMNILVSE